MQLAILIAMLMLVGQSNFTQIKPIIEQFGGEEAKSAIEQAEELNQMISAIHTLASPQESVNQPPESKQTAAEQSVQNAHPLDPIKNIADERTLSAFSTIIALGE